MNGPTMGCRLRAGKLGIGLRRSAGREEETASVFGEAIEVARIASEVLPGSESTAMLLL